MNLTGLGFLPSTGFALTKGSRRKDGTDVTRCPKSVGRELGCCKMDTLLLVSEKDGILKSKISSYVEKNMVLGKSQHKIHRGKS